MVSIQKKQKSLRNNTKDKLLFFLQQRGSNTQLKQDLHLTPAAKGSGKTDISINHDQIITEQSEKE